MAFTKVFRARVYYVKDRFRDGFTYEIQSSGDMGENWALHETAKWTYANITTKRQRAARRWARAHLKECVSTETALHATSEEVIYP